MEPILDDLQLGAWRTLLNTHATLLQRIEHALASEHLPPLDWYDVLWALYRAPDHRLRMSELAEHTVLSRSGLTRLVDRMEAAGVLERHLADEDRRGFYAAITGAGEALLHQMWPVYGGCVQESFSERLDDH